MAQEEQDPSGQKHEYTCRICGNSSENTYYTAREMMYGMRDRFLYFQCRDCECLQIAEFPEDLSKYYPTDYYSFSTYAGKKFKGIKGKVKKAQYKSYIFSDSLLQRLFSKALPAAQFAFLKPLHLERNSRILDVGCGNGNSFLYPLAAIGFHELLGCDPFIPADIHYDNSLKIVKKDIFAIEGSWDLITYHHSFEHIPDPLENLQHVRDILAPGGTCIIRIPTVSSYAWEHYRTNWAQLDAPRHLFLHSRKSMELLANKSGLEMYDILYDSHHFQFSGSEKLANDIPLSQKKPTKPVPFLKRKIKKIGYQRRSKELNKAGRGDQAAFYFRIKS